MNHNLSPRHNNDPINTGRIKSTPQFEDGTRNVRYDGRGSVHLSERDALGHFNPLLGIGVAGISSMTRTRFFIGCGLLMVDRRLPDTHPTFYDISSRLDAGQQLPPVELGGDWGSELTGQPEPVGSVSFRINSSNSQETTVRVGGPNPLAVAGHKLELAAHLMEQQSVSQMTIPNAYLQQMQVAKQRQIGA